MLMGKTLVMFLCCPCFLQLSPHFPLSSPPASQALPVATAAGVVVAGAVVVRAVVVVLGTVLLAATAILDTVVGSFQSQTVFLDLIPEVGNLQQVSEVVAVVMQLHAVMLDALIPFVQHFVLPDTVLLEAL